MTRTVHIVGAGLAGLSAAVALRSAGTHVVVHEASNLLGGRCRSYPDAATGLVLDNGNHLMLSGNAETLAYLHTIGGDKLISAPQEAAFPFLDRASGERWTLRMNGGRIPWWILNPRARVPGTRARDYLALAPLMRRRGTDNDVPVSEIVKTDSLLFRRLAGPLLLAALNIAPADGSAALASAIVRETLGKGGDACRPLIAEHGLGAALVDPAVQFLSERQAPVETRSELRAITFADDRIAALDFADGPVTLAQGDAVILAVPPYAASTLVPGLRAPTAFHSILNAHYRIDPPAGFPPLLGVINGTAEWIFAFPSRLSVTISYGDRLLDTPREELARMVWQDVAAAAGLTCEMPRWQIIRERRATFAASPQENAKRPGARTAWNNLILAGDWIATGLPATIESAVQSGHNAARMVLKNA